MIGRHCYILLCNWWWNITAIIALKTTIKSSITCICLVSGKLSWTKIEIMYISFFPSIYPKCLLNLLSSVHLCNIQVFDIAFGKLFLACCVLSFWAVVATASAYIASSKDYFRWLTHLRSCRAGFLHTYHRIRRWRIHTLRPEQNRWYLADDMSNAHLFQNMCAFIIQSSLKFVLQDAIDNI